MSTLSARADMVSGGDVLVRIDLPVAGLANQLAVELNGTDVTRAFHANESARSLTGLVTGLRVGSNTLVARMNDRTGVSGSLTMVNYPITGPIFSGLHEQPFICMTETFRGVPGGLGKPLDRDCSVETRVEHRYKALDGTFKPLPAGVPRPTDVASTTTSEGKTVPYIVLIETGTVNRGIYQTAILHDPALPMPSPSVPAPAWNGRLVYTFGGGVQPGWYIQGQTTGVILDTSVLSQGYAIASSSLNVFGQNANDVLAAETVMMVKERFIERYGIMRYTIGMGCSGGSFQVHQIGDNYPGLFDGIIPGCSFPDVGFGGQGLDIADGGLLLNYFTKTAPGVFTIEQQRQVAGYGKHGDLARDVGRADRLDPDGASSCHADLPVPLRYHPVTNPRGARCEIYDHTVNVYGRDPKTGFARRALDNVGVQYGLGILNSGGITKAQFLDLNDRIGGYDLDFNYVPQRSIADPQAMRAAYETGRLLSGGGGLAGTPIIDYRAYADLNENPRTNPDGGDAHKRIQSFMTRARLDKVNGNHAGHVMLVQDNRYGLFSTNSPVLREALAQMDRWLDNLSRDTSGDPRATRVARAKPADLVDACWTPDSIPKKIVETQSHTGGQCHALYPVFRDPRLVAGGPLASDIIKCQLKPIPPSDYSVAFTPEEQARLRKIFPDGVCDWSRPGIEQRPLVGTWLSF
ncbi:MAG: hypothetical protein EXR93_09700 [Gemmatimonadetes bacterium]|nr:hypothetical protein [Gemmatimonadota bacterium]